MDRLDMLGSFANGFRRTDISDIVNAMYIAKTVLCLELPFEFQSRGSRGVDSLEIRKLFFFSTTKTKKNHKRVFEVAKQLSQVDSKKLGWLAQYIMNGETHLFKKEVREALEIQKALPR